MKVKWQSVSFPDNAAPEKSSHVGTVLGTMVLRDEAFLVIADDDTGAIFEVRTHDNTLRAVGGS